MKTNSLAEIKNCNLISIKTITYKVYKNEPGAQPCSSNFCATFKKISDQSFVLYLQVLNAFNFNNTVVTFACETN